jgi:chromosome partitioning protein
MTITLSSVNLKGGVGKTAIAVNFAAYCGSLGFKTLLIDLDPQTNASFSSIGLKAWTEHIKAKGSVADLLGARANSTAEGRQKSVEEVVFKDAFHNVDLIPSHIDLFTVDLDLSGVTAREKKLSKALKGFVDNYDIVVCDCPPNLTLPTQNALAISTHYLIPVSLDFLSSIGIALLINRLKSFSEDLDIQLENAGIVLSRVGRPALHRENTETTLRNQFKDLVLNQSLKERVAVSEASEKHISVFEHRDSEAAYEFRAVSQEILKRIGASSN